MLRDEVWLVLAVVEVRALCSSSRAKDFFMDLAWCMGTLMCGNQKETNTNCCHNVGSALLSNVSL